jgi:hypothetical protein
VIFPMTEEILEFQSKIHNLNLNELMVLIQSSIDVFEEKTGIKLRIEIADKYLKIRRIKK